MNKSANRVKNTVIGPKAQMTKLVSAGTTGKQNHLSMPLMVKNNPPGLTDPAEYITIVYASL
jgi:hypothetical protein